jgi:hypothetical protein
VAKAQVGPPLWRQLSMGIAVLGLVLVAANFLTWFSVERTQTNPVGTYVRTAAGFEGRFGWLEVAYGLVAVMLGLICFFQHPTTEVVRRTMGFLFVVPLIGLAVVAADWGAAASDSGTTTPGIGLILTIVCLLAWLACAVVLRRMAGAASRTVAG